MVAPEIDAREKAINEDQEMRVQTRALLCEDLGLVICDSLLILSVSTVAECSPEPWRCQSPVVKVVRMLSCAPETVKSSREEETRSRGPCSHLVPLGRKALPSLWAFEIQGNGSSTSNC